MKVDVALAHPKLDYLTYESDLNLCVGDLVLVPLRKKEQPGIVLRTGVSGNMKNLKKVKAVIEPGFIDPMLLAFYRWLSDYFFGLLGDVLRFAFPARILNSRTVIKEVEQVPASGTAPVLTEAQEQAVQRINRYVYRPEFRVFLIHGITGSGKTEIYLHCLQAAVQAGGRGLVLVPEISMTPMFLNQFRQRFGPEVTAYHSGLTARERREVWHGIKAGRFKVVIGPRSAILLPISDLRLIVVDEEHDPSYKEHQQSLKYNARDAAVMRGKIQNLPVVLGSATPQIESYYNARVGKYELITLKERIAERPLPIAEIIDLKSESHRIVSRRLEKALVSTLEQGGQAIIFLNRRGFAPYLICPNCGYTAACPHCGLPLVYHRQPLTGLFCHVCDYRSTALMVCPRCRRSTMLYRGAGTQRVEELIRKIIADLPLSTGQDPRSMVLRLDRDTVRRRGETESIFNRFAVGTGRVLLGTQLVTKGLDFPGVTLVGIINADVIFNLPDFRSAERTFQILTQVAGRSGRGHHAGRVYIQTLHPEQYAIVFGQLQDYLKFYHAEIKNRQELFLPPFSRLILLRFRGPDEALVRAAAQQVFADVSKVRGVKAFGPNPSFYSKIRRDFRYYVLIKIGLLFPRRRLEFLRDVRFKSVIFEIDVDPQEVF